MFRNTAAELAAIVAAAGEEKVDVHDLLMRLTLDSIFQVGFGVSLGAVFGTSSEEGAAFAGRSTTPASRCCTASSTRYGRPRGSSTSCRRRT